MLGGRVPEVIKELKDNFKYSKYKIKQIVKSISFVIDLLHYVQSSFLNFNKSFFSVFGVSG